jgi:hypothetical protein
MNNKKQQEALTQPLLSAILPSNVVSGDSTMKSFVLSVARCYLGPTPLKDLISLYNSGSFSTTEEFLARGTYTVTTSDYQYTSGNSTDPIESHDINRLLYATVMSKTILSQADITSVTTMTPTFGVYNMAEHGIKDAKIENQMIRSAADAVLFSQAYLEKNNASVETVTVKLATMRQDIVPGFPILNLVDANIYYVQSVSFSIVPGTEASTTLTLIAKRLASNVQGPVNPNVLQNMTYGFYGSPYVSVEGALSTGNRPLSSFLPNYGGSLYTVQDPESSNVTSITYSLTKLSTTPGIDFPLLVSNIKCISNTQAEVPSCTVTWDSYDFYKGTHISNISNSAPGILGSPPSDGSPEWATLARALIGGGANLCFGTLSTNGDKVTVNFENSTQAMNEIGNSFGVGTAGEYLLGPTLPSQEVIAQETQTTEEQSILTQLKPFSN